MDNNRSSSALNTRLHYMDKLKVCIIIMVIIHHAGQAYGPTGGKWPITNTELSALLGPFFAINAAFGMGLLFLISGYFTAHSLEHKDSKSFLKNRLVRLGAPVLFFILFVTGPIAYVNQSAGTTFIEFIGNLYRDSWQDLYAHLWFLAHLLVYSIGYVFLRELIPNFNKQSDIEGSPPSHTVIVAYVTLLALVSFVVRIWYPIDTWIPFLLLIPAEVAHLPQYASLFAIGILAGKRNWFQSLPTATAFTWLFIGVLGATVFYIYDLSGLDSPRAGRGWMDWRSLIFSTWESVICVGLSVGLLVLFREKFNSRMGSLISALSASAFGAYIVHLLVVIGLQAAIAAWPLAPMIKFLLVSIFGVALSFGISYWAQQARWSKVLEK